MWESGYARLFRAVLHFAVNIMAEIQLETYGCAFCKSIQSAFKDAFHTRLCFFTTLPSFLHALGKRRKLSILLCTEVSRGQRSRAFRPTDIKLKISIPQITFAWKIWSSRINFGGIIFSVTPSLAFFTLQTSKIVSSTMHGGLAGSKIFRPQLYMIPNHKHIPDMKCYINTTAHVSV